MRRPKLWRRLPAAVRPQAAAATEFQLVSGFEERGRMPFVPHTEEQRAAMLADIGVASFDELLAAVPSELILRRDLKVPPAHGEIELAKAASGIQAANQFIPLNRVFAGGGF